MGSQIPFRLPCETTSSTPKYFFGGPFQHNLAPQLVDKFVNIATVPNPAGSGPDVPAYERWTPDPSGPAGCEAHNCDTDPGSAPCSPWIGTGDVQYNLASPGPNTFNKSGQVDFANAHKRGFKNVHAMRSWHGCFGWTSENAACNTNFCPDGSSYESYHPNPDQTKYTTATYDLHFSNTFFDGGSDTGDLTGARTVNITTGETTSTVISTQTTIENSGFGLNTVFFTNGGAGYHADPDTGIHTINFASGGSTRLDNEFDFHCGTPIFRIDNASLGDLSGFIAAWNGGAYAGGDPDINPFVPASGLPPITDPNNYSASDTGTINAGLTHYSTTISFTRTDTTLSWDFQVQDDLDDPSGVHLNIWHHYGTITLSATNTSAQVYADIKSLLGNWPLNDDALYPWRTDTKVSVAPLVTRLELQNASPLGFNPYTVDDMTSPINDSGGNVPFSVGWTPTYNQRAWFDPNIYQWKYPTGHSAADSAASALVKMFDGSVQGAPQAAGFQNFFAYSFIDYTACCFVNPDDGAQSWDLYQLGWGMNASQFNARSGAQIPLNATQWTNFSQARNLPDGAFLFYADKGANYYAQDCPPSNDSVFLADNGGLFACKAAVILDIWNSQNFARPAGDDKFSFDETAGVYCASNASGSGAGSTWSITDADTNIPADGTDFSGIWGGPVVGGFYNVASYSGGVLTLGALAWNVPSDWASASVYDTGSCFGKLRFPDCPSLLGHIAVTPDTAGTIMMFAPAQPTFGMNPSTHQESVDLWDASMTKIADGVTATRVDDSHFTIGSAQKTAAFVTIHGAPAWYMNDNQPKGDYLFQEWVSDFRSAGEYQRLTGVLDCSGTQVAQPTTNAGGGPVANTFASYTQTAGCLPFVPCSPKVVCISPNGEDFPNGMTYPFPAIFVCDERYGSKWWGFVEAIMTDVFWQTPHRPCGFVDPDTGETLQWLMDDGTCKPIADPVDPDTGFVTHIRYYAHSPQVEAVGAVPCNYGAAQNECAPALPTGLQVGWLSPVNYNSGDVALPPTPPGPGDDATPLGAVMAFAIHQAFCASAAGCRFNYNLPSC